MKIVCPGCGKKIVVSVSGRKKLEVPVKNIYDGLAVGKNITDIARELGCSRGYIYKVLKDNKNG